MIFSPHGVSRGGVFCLVMTPQKWTVGDTGPYNGNKNSLKKARSRVLFFFIQNHTRSNIPSFSNMRWFPYIPRLHQARFRIAF